MHSSDLVVGRRDENMINYGMQQSFARLRGEHARLNLITQPPDIIDGNYHSQPSGCCTHHWCQTATYALTSNAETAPTVMLADLGRSQADRRQALQGR